MSTTPADIVRAAFEAAREECKKQNLAVDDRKLAKLFREVADEFDATARVRLITPTEDAGTLKSAVEKMFSQKLGKTVVVEHAVDKTLLGGAVVQYGDERIDVSLRGALERAAEAIASA